MMEFAELGRIFTFQITDMANMHRDRNSEDFSKLVLPLTLPVNLSEADSVPWRAINLIINTSTQPIFVYNSNKRNVYTRHYIKIP